MQQTKHTSFLCAQDLEDLTTLIFPVSTPHPSEVALILGTPNYTARFAEHIFRLWQKGTTKHFIFSGYKGEAEKIAEAAQYLGLPDKAVYLEKNASNTRENVLFSMDLIQQLGRSKTILALTRLHSARRGQMTLTKYLTDWTISIDAVNSFDVSRHDWHECAPFVERVAGEIKRILLYLSRDHLAYPPDLKLSSDRIQDLSKNLEAYYAQSLAPLVKK